MKKPISIKRKTEYPNLTKVFENPDFVYDLGYDGIRLESGKNASATLTFYRDSKIPNNLKQTIKTMSSLNFSGSLKFILPGKIVESTLDHIEENTTWSKFNSEDEKMVLQQSSALDEAAIVTFEKGGLPLIEVLDSQKARDLAAESTKIDRNISLTKTSDGYVAEAMSVTTTRIIPFPGREEYSSKFQSSLSQEKEGIVVSKRC